MAPVRHCGVHWVSTVSHTHHSQFPLTNAPQLAQVTADAALHQALLHQPLSLSLYRCPRHGVDREHSGVDRDGGVDHGSGGDVLGTAGLDLAPLLAGCGGGNLCSPLGMDNTCTESAQIPHNMNTACIQILSEHCYHCYHCYCCFENLKFLSLNPLHPWLPQCCHPLNPLGLQ